MSNHGKIHRFAADADEPIETFLPRIVREEGSTYRAAAKLGVAPNTVIYWMRKLGYEARMRVVVEWTRIAEAQS